MAGVAVVLVAIGLFCCGMFRVLGQSEHRAYASGAAPRAVHVTSGQQYILAVRGGTKKLLERGVDVTNPNCTWSVGGTEAQALTVSPAGSNAKGTNAVASFIAPYTGDLHIECTNFGGVFVDNADDAGTDRAGWFLFAGVIALLVGGGLGVSAARSASLARSVQGASSEYDEVQGLVDVPSGSLRDDEVGRPYPGHIRR
jgi:hypothetical protein